MNAQNNTQIDFNELTRVQIPALVHFTKPSRKAPSLSYVDIRHSQKI